MRGGLHRWLGLRRIGTIRLGRTMIRLMRGSRVGGAGRCRSDGKRSGSRAGGGGGGGGTVSIEGCDVGEGGQGVNSQCTRGYAGGGLTCI